MLSVLRRFPHITFFGFVLSFTSGPGQTFFIALFNPQIQQHLQFTNTQLSVTYSIATLLAALVLPLFGWLLDRFDQILLILFAFYLGLAGGAVVITYANSIMILCLAFFLLRLFGQSALPLVARTVLTKRFEHFRGRSLAIASIGYPLSEAVFPVIASFFLSVLSVSWQNTWLAISGMVICLLLPIASYLYLNFEAPENGFSPKAEKSVKQDQKFCKSETSNRPHERGLSSKLFIKDWRFFVLIPVIVFNPFALTAIFFHQGTFAESRGWSLAMVAQGFVFYGIFRAVGSIIIGSLIDRFKAYRLLNIHMLPLIIGLTVFTYITDITAFYLFMALAGFTVGAGSNVKSVVFAELYGIANLGTINSVAVTFMVISTAIAPIILGAALDAEVLVSTILFFLLLTAIIAQASSLLVTYPFLRQKKEGL